MPQFCSLDSPWCLAFGHQGFDKLTFPRTQPRILNSRMIRILATIFAGLLGLAFGSFLNVCLSRWPAGESIVTPALPLPQLHPHTRLVGEHPAPKLANPPRPLPQLQDSNQLALSAGRVGDLCTVDRSRMAISRWNPESLECRHPYSSSGWLHSSAEWPFIGCSSHSPRSMPNIFGLPDWLTCPVLRSDLSTVSCQSRYSPMDSYVASWGIFIPVRAAVATLIEIAIAFSLILLIRWLYKLIRHRDGLGLGDAKLMALLAAWLGLPGALLAFAIGVVLGAAHRPRPARNPDARTNPQSWATSKLPLGTFLCIGGVVSSLWGQSILARLCPLGRLLVAKTQQIA